MASLEQLVIVEGDDDDEGEDAGEGEGPADDDDDDDDMDAAGACNALVEALGEARSVLGG
jgi:hypothetical protein